MLRRLVVALLLGHGSKVTRRDYALYSAIAFRPFHLRARAPGGIQTMESPPYHLVAARSMPVVRAGHRLMPVF
jgi:hypothetical protein